MMVTKQGVIKKTPLEDFENIRRTGIIAISLKKGDSLKWAQLTTGAEQVVLATRQGQSIRFDEKQVRPMGRTAAGVRAIKLKKQNDEVAGFDIIRGDDAMLLVVMEHGFAKQTSLKEYKMQSRGGSGIKTAEMTAKTGPVVSAHVVSEEKEIFALSAKGQMIRTETRDGSKDRTFRAGRAHHGPQERRSRCGYRSYLIVSALYKGQRTQSGRGLKTRKNANQAHSKTDHHYRRRRVFGAYRRHRIRAEHPFERRRRGLGDQAHDLGDGQPAGDERFDRLTLARDRERAQISYTQIDPSEYQNKLLAAFAAGTGPDIFEIGNRDLPQWASVATPVPATLATTFSQITLQTDFPDVVSRRFRLSARKYLCPAALDRYARDDL